MFTLPTERRSTVVARLVCLLFFVVLGVGLWPTAANAHAKLDGTVPANGAVLETAPSAISVVFDEEVGLGLGSVRVFDESAQRVDDGNPTHPQNAPGTVVLKVGNLGPGSYVITWRVTSIDGHPVRGASTFRVGNGDAQVGQALAERLLAADGGSVAVGAAFAVTRAIVFAALLSGIGALFFWAFVADLGTRVRRLSVLSLLVLALFSALEFALQGSYVSGLGLASTVDPTLWSSTIDDRYGQAALARAGLALILAIVLLFVGRVGSMTVKRLLALSGVGIIVSLSLAGHATTGRWPELAFVLDVVHVAAASAWIGGLGVMAYVALRPSVQSTLAESLADVVERFSVLAFNCVVVLGVTGVIQGYRQVGSIDGLFTTNYGVVLALKVVVFVGLVTVAAFARKGVRRANVSAAPIAEARTEDSASVEPSVAVPTVTESIASVPGPIVSRLRKFVAVELALAVVVVSLTSLLVNAEPPQANGGGAGESFYSELPVGDNIAAVSIHPSAQGVNQVHIYVIDKAGSPTSVEDASLSLALPSKEIEAIPVGLEHLTPDHFASYTFDIPLSGRWLASLTLRTSAVDQATVQFDVPVS